MTPGDPFETKDESAPRMTFAAVSSVAMNILFLVGAGIVFRQHPALLTDSSRYITVRLLPSVLPRKTQERTNSPQPQIVGPAKPKAVTPPARHAPTVLSAPVPAASTAATHAPRPASKKQPLFHARTPVLLAKSSETPEHNDFVAKAEGDASVGSGMTHPGEVSGEGNTSGTPTGNADTGSGAAPAPNRAPEPIPQAAPVPVAETQPAGPSQDARATHQELPRIPASLRSNGYKSFVRVEVKVEPDGSFTPTVVTTSGSPDIDDLVLLAMKRWRWEPELKDGVAVASSHIIRVDYEVN